MDRDEPIENFEARRAIDDARRAISLAKVRCLPFRELLERLRHLFDDAAPDELIFAIGELSRNDDESRQLAQVISDLVQASDRAPGRKEWFDRRLRDLLATLPAAYARPIAMACLAHRRKSRRTAGFRTMALHDMDEDSTRMFICRFGETGDERFLKELLRHPLQLAAADPARLIQHFEGDEYWQMRVVEATMRANVPSSLPFAKSHPHAFIWAAGRLRQEQFVSTIRECLNASNDKTALIGIVTWAFGKLNAYADLEALEALLDILDDQIRDHPELGRDLRRIRPPT